MGIDSAVINFNGASSIPNVMKEYGLQGHYASIFRGQKEGRIKECLRKQSEKGKASRKRQRYGRSLETQIRE